MAELTRQTGRGVLAPGATLEKLAPNDRILQWGVDQRLTTFLQPAGRANGMCFDPGGQLIACADDRNELWSIAPEGTVSVLVRDYEGRRTANVSFGGKDRRTLFITASTGLYRVQLRVAAANRAK